MPKGRGWRFDSLAVKSPFYLTENFPGGQLPPVLWRWYVNFLSHIMYGVNLKENKLARQ